MNPLSALYGGATRLRRAWYARHPERRRRLDRPVVSVGNLAVGGSGKTPVVAYLARMLRQAGERPAILSRGYKRRHTADEVVVVGDGERVLADVEHSGDEPQMLARTLPGVPVVVSPDRHRAGLLAADRFSSTVFLLDDGYQHVRLERDVDLLIVAPGDLDEPVLPVGRLREPLDAAGVADALLVYADRAGAIRVSDTLGVRGAFSITTRYDAVRPIAGGDAAMEPAGRRAVAVAGIARPARFFAALREQGWNVVREISFADHHWFTARDLARIETIASRAGADAIVTTEKDAVRLSQATVAPAGPWAVLPMHVDIEPGDVFASWLLARLSAARSA